MSVMALSNPRIAFNFSVDHKCIFSHKPMGRVKFLDVLKQTANTVLKPNYVSSMSPIDISRAEFGLKGFVGSMLDTSSSRKGQYLFINKRAVTSKLISDTVTECFSTRIQNHEHIPFILFLEMPFDLVDVNVHPKKTQVRFCDPQTLQNFIRYALNQLLEKSTEFKNKLHFAPKNSFFSEDVAKTAQDFAFDNFIEVKTKTVNKDQIEVFDDLEDHVVALFTNFLFMRDFVNKTEKVLVFDLKRMQKSLAYKDLARSIDSKTATLSMQGLLKSQSLQVRADLYIIIRDNLVYFKKLGIHLRDFGNNTFVLDALFKGYQEDRVLELIESLALCIRKQKGVRIEKFLQLSSQFSVKAKSSFTQQEAIELTKQALKGNKSFKDQYAVPFVVYFEQKQFDYLANLSEEICIQ